MKQIDKIYKYILSNSREFTKEKLFKIKGFSAQQVAEHLGILRSNASRELNILRREKKIIKIKNRPVLYFDREQFIRILNVNLNDECEEGIEINDFINLLEDKEDKSPFDSLIGFNTSLKNQIEQAKAALLYPPNGLHTLIIGSTGVGKSLFANMMYKYYKNIKQSQEDPPFIIFNCADYSNNPQLLLSHIFGHVKGAFTGAEKEKEGIVEKADGGILFLDEIHRLPPEGQEMVFYFMDTGTYNKLGETDRQHKANVLLIGATTEDPNSTLLKTFIRRIPITITIPPFDERPINEKLDLVQYLLSKEAQRVNKTIKISSEAIKALIGSTNYGNVGQLKSNIQLVCAKGFFNCINTNKDIEINLSTLPPNIKSGILAFGNQTKDKTTIWNMIPNNITIQPDGNRKFLETDDYETPFNIYRIIESKTSVLQEEGMNDEEIKRFITTDISIHLKQFYDRFNNDISRREGLLKIVDKNIVEFSEKIKILAENRLNRKLNERFIYATSLHFSALFNRIKKNTVSYESNIDLSIPIESKEYEVAKEIHALIEKNFNLSIPNVEIEYLALLLNSIQESSRQERVGIVVASHGSGIASSMVNVAKKLFEADNILAVDMPLERAPSDVLDNVIEKVKEVDEGKGVLLLVDMGSLNSFADVITEKTGINIKSIDMVSTPLVLEAVRKCSVCDADLNSVYSYLLTDFRGYTNNINTQAIQETKEKNKVIITVCSTGKGAAIKLKELVETVTNNIGVKNINIISLGLTNLTKSIKKIQEENNILAIIGIANPNLGIQFISIEQLIDGTGENILISIIQGKKIEAIKNTGDKQIIFENICKETIAEFITFLNPQKIYSLLNEFLNCTERLLSEKFENPVKLRIMFHVACALERMLLNNGLVYDECDINFDKKTIEALKEASLIFKNALSINLTDDEIYYIADIIG
ncbi:sigma 54-interacting transcriptional regulator [Clostridium beijerinckii]|uniref:Transcriptional regulatory protein LevR/transcriptional regulator with AAA-type ATPase domain n=1 Tax=Clostridium beijerinckii TaxID=1520 RepID=A0A9Q5CNX9_CLOBE|nr:sigma-54-dependent transcriptional regulator [Clostridium beijerinckii]AQS06693.1 regulatory protein LuxO [Clostridium beijerinckii]MBA2887691.1 transcriptional regulatory protein LevR/transcriptional regulator with AAA-type ATPase domain [Clostridium beijerinckii]MBA2901655.1 transcriptional regulatory protein LevR/transcriptional regulator with AAA-type ATPase domain [Clostridium beijerinckii]MBA2911458.1 transcriptional regulatory protein LevR/transcriptional regulator with AAA-type ATPas